MRNNVGRSDLDVFEGLGKKSTARVSRAPSPSSVPPPPPPAVRRVQGVPRASGKQTSSGRSPFAQPPLPRLGGSPAPVPFLVPTPAPSPSAMKGAPRARVSNVPPLHPADLEELPTRRSSRPVPMFPPLSVVASTPFPDPPLMPRALPPGSQASGSGLIKASTPSWRPLPPTLQPPPKPAPIVHRVEIAPSDPHRTPDARRTPLVTLVALGVVALVVAAVYLMPHAGQIAVNVADSKGGSIPHLSVFIDGKKQCDWAPCVVSGVAAGSHTVRVTAKGFEPPADKAVAVESRKDTTVDYGLALLASGGTGVRVTGTQPGTKLFVDDKEIGPLPQGLHDMAPGNHKVRIAGSDRYAPLEKTVTVTKDELLDLGDVTLKVVKGKATFLRETPGVRLFITSGTDHWEIPELPLAVDIDTSKQWSLVASKPGYGDYRQPISFDDGQAEKAFTVALDTKMATAALGDPAPAAYSPPTYRPAFMGPATAGVAGGRQSASGDAEAAAAGQGFLKINSLPAASVLVDGKLIGTTPKVKYRVSSGTHTLVFFNPERGFRKEMSVTVAAGETKAAISKN